MSAPALPTTELPLRGPFRLAVATVAVSIVLILMGAMVTSTGSGMAFPDWPLSDGQLMPERALTQAPAFFEHFHRVVGMVDGCLALALTIWVSAARIGTARLRNAVVVGLVLIGVQGLIGGNGVLQNLPVANSVAHATLAQLAIATFAVLAYALSPRWRATVPAPHPSARAGRKLAIVGVALLIAQTVLGAIARHANDSRALWTHVGNAFAVFLLLLIVSGFAVGRFGAVPGVRRLSQVLLLLLVLQIGLGFTALLVRMGKHPENIEHLWRASLISAHVLTGALLTVTATLLAAHVHRGTVVARP